MGLSKSGTLQYETTPFKINKKAVKDKLDKNTLEDVRSANILIFLIKRHKFGILLTFFIWQTLIMTGMWTMLLTNLRGY